jgi:hypothetical protein
MNQTLNEILKLLEENTGGTDEDIIISNDLVE